MLQRKIQATHKPILVLLLNIVSMLIVRTIGPVDWRDIVPDSNIIGTYIIVVVGLSIAGILLFESYILGYLNTIIVILLSGTINIIYLVVGLGVSLIFTRKLHVGETLSIENISSLSKTETPTLLHTTALFLATTAISIPLAFLVIRTMATVQLSAWMPGIVIASVILLILMMFFETQPIDPIIAGVLAAFSYLGIVPAIAYISGKLHLVPRPTGPHIEGEKTIILGRITAKLVYGYPRNPYSRTPVHRKDKKTWYWARAPGKELFSVSLDALPNKHMVIVGASGMGKSSLAKKIIIQAYKMGYNFIVLDPHGEYGDLAEEVPDIKVLDASSISLNPLELDGTDPSERAHQLSYTIKSMFNLGHLQRQAIEDLIVETYKSKGIYPDRPETWSNKPPVFSDIVDMARYLSRENDLVKKIYPYLRILSSRVFSSSSLEFRTIMEKPVVVVLNTLTSDYIRSLYIHTFLQKIVYSMYRRNVGKETLIVIDEAHLVFHRGAGRVASKLFMESRKYGIGLIAIAQQPLSLPEPVFQNTSVKIAFNTSEPRNLDYLSRLFSGSDNKSKINAVKYILRIIDKNQYIVSVSGLDGLYLLEMIE